MNFVDINNTKITDDYERMNNFELIFCPDCGAMNLIYYDWCGNIMGLQFCMVCGKEL